MVDKLAKEAALKDGPIVYSKIPREVITTRERKGTKQVAKAVGDHRKRGGDQSFLPISDE
jgi:hypothetical protein